MSISKAKILKSPEMDWISANKEWLEREHAGEYIAVSGSTMVSHGPDPIAVHEEAARSGHAGALIHRVLLKEYQGLRFVRLVE